MKNWIKEIMNKNTRKDNLSEATDERLLSVRETIYPTDKFENMEKYLPREYWDKMMYMRDVGDICLYKHVYTRRYINIDSNGNFYLYNGDGYSKVDKDYAIDYMLS